MLRIDFVPQLFGLSDLAMEQVHLPRSYTALEGYGLQQEFMQS